MDKHHHHNDEAKQGVTVEEEPFLNEFQHKLIVGLFGAGLAIGMIIGVINLIKTIISVQ